MANKRMFSNEITSSDPFLDMPVSARELYFQLGMNGDDDGFVSPKRIMRMIGATDDDLRILIMRGFVLSFADGVIVITHRKRNNFIRMDRYKKTVYEEHLRTLKLENDIYFKENEETAIQNGLVVKGHTNGIPRLGKDRLNKDRLVEEQAPSSLDKASNKEISLKSKALSGSVFLDIRKMLKDKEYDKLCKKFGKDKVDDKIEAMEEWIINKNKSKGFEDYNLALNKWLKKDNPSKIYTEEEIGILMLNKNHPKSKKILEELKKQYTEEQLKGFMDLYLNSIVYGK